MKTLFATLILLEVICALVVFTNIFINSEKTIKETAETAVAARNNSNSETKIAWEKAEKKFDREQMFKGIAIFGTLFFPGLMVGIGVVEILRRKKLIGNRF